MLGFFKDNQIYSQLLNLTTCWRGLLFSLACALVLCFLYILFLSWFAEYLAWAIIILTQLGFLAVTGGAIYGYVTYKDETTKTYALVFSIVFGLLSLIFGCCLWCGWKSLNLAIEMVNVSADFLAQTKRVFAVPFIYNLFMIVFFVFWLTCIVSLYSLGEISADP